ncbi:MAG: GNAT family N-acetyltransferase [Christensenella sp.]|nr:GNAT family N-acetyltransferase [Christensenella sp.]
MSKARLKKISTEREYLLTADLAHQIWREHYSAFIGADQIEYMLEKFQSVNALKAAVAADGYEYYLIKKTGVPIGYAGIKTNHPAGKLFLSKFYILKDYRGRGFAKDVIAELIDMASRLRLKSIWLTVSKNNESAMTAYRRLGFTQTDSICMDIGGGFVMDDYIFERSV